MHASYTVYDIRKACLPLFGSEPKRTLGLRIDHLAAREGEGEQQGETAG
jgi:hypothetical protein